MPTSRCSPLSAQNAYLGKFAAGETQGKGLQAFIVSVDPALDAYWSDRHAVGDLAFEAAFVTAPAQVNPGLGPLFNSTACAGCHIKNGRGLPEKGQRVVRVSQLEPGQGTGVDQAYALEAEPPGANALAVAGLGTQVQEQGVYGHAPEAVVQLAWVEQSGTYADGTAYPLRSPQITLLSLDGTPLPEGITTSHRIAQPVFGAGLLEAVPEADIVQRADAYANDMGVTNPLFPAADGQRDIDMDTLAAAAVYVQTIGVPARTLVDDPQVQRGERLFGSTNCVACHVSERRSDSMARWRG